LLAHPRLTLRALEAVPRALERTVAVDPPAVVAEAVAVADALDVADVL
jgi:hypothetical protein